MNIRVRCQLCEPDPNEAKEDGDKLVNGEYNPIFQSIERNDGPVIEATINLLMELWCAKFELGRDEVLMVYVLKGFFIDGGSGINVGIRFF